MATVSDHELRQRPYSLLLSAGAGRRGDGNRARVYIPGALDGFGGGGGVVVVHLQEDAVDEEGVRPMT